MTPARSLAAAQTTPVAGDVEANVRQHLTLGIAAADAGARIVVFPELSLTGYELDLASGLAFGERDPRLAPLVALAEARDMTLVAGAPVRLDGGLHIGAFIISPDSTLDIYTKHHLGAFPPGVSNSGIAPPAEETVFAPGARDPLVRSGGSLAAVAVCADINKPSHPEAAADRGADTYLAGMFIIPADVEQDHATLRRHAVRHRMTIVLANFGGPSGGLGAAGESAIWSDEGELLALLPDAGAGVAVAIETDQGWSTKTIMA